MSNVYTFDDDTVSDLHKDAYGFRPKRNFWSAWAAFNGDQKQAVWDDLCDTAERAMEYQRAREARAVENFEQTVASLMATGARDAGMAMRWLHEAHDTNGDDGYLEYCLGLPYGYIARSREAV